MNTVIVTAIGSFAADIVIKNLKKNQFKVIGLDIYPKPWIADAYNVNVFYQVPMAVNEKEFIETILDICKRENVNFIIPLTDIEIDVFNNNRLVFEEQNVCICISSTNTIRICRDKRLLHDFLDANVSSIRTIPTVDAKDQNSIPFEYPMIAKLYNGRSSQGLYKIFYYPDWVHFLANKERDKYIIQPFIPGNVITVDVIRDSDGANVVAIPRIELLRTINGAGTSVKVFSDVDLEEQCKKIADALKILGCVNFEFICDDFGHYYFVECNPRFSGGVEFSCIAGYDCVINHMRCFQKRKIDAIRKNQNTIYIARKYEEYTTEIWNDDKIV